MLCLRYLKSGHAVWSRGGIPQEVIPAARRGVMPVCRPWAFDVRMDAGASRSALRTRRIDSFSFYRPALDFFGIRFRESVVGTDARIGSETNSGTPDRHETKKT
jgi:hypothetical protein